MAIPSNYTKYTKIDYLVYTEISLARIENEKCGGGHRSFGWNRRSGRKEVDRAGLHNVCRGAVGKNANRELSISDDKKTFDRFRCGGPAGPWSHACSPLRNLDIFAGTRRSSRAAVDQTCPWLFVS